jgi:hypothetical protein
MGKKQPQCVGYTALKGKPLWAKGVCPIYAFTSEKGINHCGFCNEFPRERLANHYDPTNLEGQRNAVCRIGVTSYRTRHGDEKTTVY